MAEGLLIGRVGRTFNSRADLPVTEHREFASFDEVDGA